MYEVELKLPASLEDVRTRLEELEATPLGGVVQEDTYYDAPHRSFPDTDEALRIRREYDADGTTEIATRLTYKGPLLEAASKTRAEHETGLEDATAMQATLEKLGFEPAAVVRKDRERYRYDDYTLTLDRVDGAGTFVEIETDVGTEAEIEAARERATHILERLGLDAAKQVRTSYLELVLEGEP